MDFSLVICTYMRAQPLLRLLNSVEIQTFYPNEILIIDGSTDNETEQILNVNQFSKLKYFKVKDNQRGLTNQRNFGIEKVSDESEVICFLDDDTVLENDYFEQLINTYNIHHKALGVGGYITNEVVWKESKSLTSKKKFFYDGYERNEPLRFKVRRFFGALRTEQPHRPKVRPLGAQKAAEDIIPRC